MRVKISQTFWKTWGSNLIMKQSWEVRFPSIIPSILFGSLCQCLSVSICFIVCVCLCLSVFSWLSLSHLVPVSLPLSFFLSPATAFCLYVSLSFYLCLCLSVSISFFAVSIQRIENRLVLLEKFRQSIQGCTKAVFHKIYLIHSWILCRI